MPSIHQPISKEGAPDTFNGNKVEADYETQSSGSKVIPIGIWDYLEHTLFLYWQQITKNLIK